MIDALILLKNAGYGGYHDHGGAEAYIKQKFNIIPCKMSPAITYCSLEGTLLMSEEPLSARLAHCSTIPIKCYNLGGMLK